MRLLSRPNASANLRGPTGWGSSVRAMRATRASQRELDVAVTPWGHTWLCWLVAWMVLLTCSACKKSETQQETVPLSVAAPDGLLCEGSARAPDATWRNLQQGIAGLTTLLPSTAFGVAAVSGGLEVMLGDLADGNRPIAFALAGNAMHPAWVVVASAKEKRAVEARFPSRGATRLVAPSTIGIERLPLQNALDSKTPPPFLVYLSSRGDLVIARDEAAADLLAPYALFSLLPNATKGDAHDVVLRVPESAMPALGNVVRLAWTKIEMKLAERDAEDRRARGRAPDYGDPAAILAAANAAVATFTELLADTGTVTLTFDTTKDGSALDVQIPSKGGAWSEVLEGMPEGSGESLANEPLTTRLAWLNYGDPSSRVRTAKVVAERLGAVFAGKIATASRDTLTSSLETLATNMGETVRVRVESDPLRATLLSKPSVEPARAIAAQRKAMTDLLSMIGREPKLREMIHVAKVEDPLTLRAGQGNTDSVPPTRTLLSELDPGKGTGARGVALAVYAREKGDMLTFSAERAPKLDLLTELSGDAPWLTSVRPELAGMLQGLGARTAFVVISGLSQAKSAEEPASFALGIGKRERGVAVRAVAPHRFARELPRIAMPDWF